MLTFRVLGRGFGAEISASVALEIADRVYVPLHDQSGSISALLDEAGTLVEYARYSAFGEQSLFDAEQQVMSESMIGNPWGYASKRMDLESGWSFFGRRYYDPKEGRWMTPDPLGFTEGPNLYAYVNNSPMTHFDLYGLSARSNNPYANPPSHLYAQAVRYANMISDLAASMWGSARPYLQMPGKLFETFSRHLLPVPGLRDVCMGVGRVMSFRPFWGCDQCKQHSTQVISSKGVEQGSVMYTGVNGICNSKGDALENLERLSAANGNVKVWGIYNASYGITLDLLCSLYLKLGGFTEASYMLADLWKQKAAESNEKPFTIIHAAHSQGSQETLAATRFFKGDDKKTLKNIEVATYGAAELISKGIFGTAKNYVSTRDAVPFIASPHRYIQAKRGRIDNVHFLKSDSFAFIDHAWGGNTYSAQIEKNGKILQERFFRAE